jgi:hypothetical protein
VQIAQFGCNAVAFAGRFRFVMLRAEHAADAGDCLFGIMLHDGVRSLTPPPGCERQLTGIRHDAPACRQASSSRRGGR